MAKAKADQTAADETQAEIEEVQEDAADTQIITDAELDPEFTATQDRHPVKVTKAGPKSRKALEEAEAEAARKAAAAQPESNVKGQLLKVSQKPNPLKQHGKNYRKAAELVDRTRDLELSDAIELAKKTVAVKFVPSLELHINLGIDPRQADQMVRASVVLPAGTGKSVRIAVLAPSAKQSEAKAAGADVVGDEDLIAKIEKGDLNFDKLIATPDVMPKLGKLAKVLGPKGLMPNPKSGTVTADVAKAVTEAKAGKVEFRNDKQGIVHVAIGKTDFSKDDLLSNAKALVNAVMKAKPAGAKGTYVKAISMATSMGPGIKLNIPKTIAESNPRK